MLKGQNIIIFSSDDWNSGLKSSKYHIAMGLSKFNRVLFVNSLGLRNPSINKNDIKRIMNKLIDFVKGFRKINANLYVFTPIAIPFKSELTGKINRFLLKGMLKITAILLKLKEPIIIVFVPNVFDLVGDFRCKSIIYYCIDELKGYRDVNKSALEAMENNLLRIADCVITCSHSLADKKRSYNPNTYYVPHGVDWNHFRSSLDEKLTEPEDIKTIGRPIIGYYGFISEDWIDFNLLDYIASSHSDWSVVLIGKTNLDLKKKVQRKNIYYLGMKRFEKLPAYNKFFNAAIIPFKISELTVNSNPLKLYEYLSSGRPVVSVNIPELLNYSGLIQIARSKEEFIEKIEGALLDDSKEKCFLRSDSMRNETWDNRIETISAIIERHIHQ